MLGPSKRRPNSKEQFLCLVSFSPISGPGVRLRPMCTPHDRDVTSLSARLGCLRTVVFEPVCARGVLCRKYRPNSPSALSHGLTLGEFLHFLDPIQCISGRIVNIVYAVNQSKTQAHMGVSQLGTHHSQRCAPRDGIDMLPFSNVTSLISEHLAVF
ncbi:hypothetical protein P154DRAFT_80465 [Amniculicola lignicola CBS 123094]|uniref:Uncharacterized protein n=1 Tax=Amniculicola lignicola CBS 123094 TaxID=1392246 RepID=A0A6A5WU28_9PLEO|nr:hypothetical protein P154DRAFT_80465 [Amniculicola lignicola CBS 123094]